MEDTKAIALLEDLGKIQGDGQAGHLPCPRCGRYRMNKPATNNALSKFAHVYVCNECGLDESIRSEPGHEQLPIQLWFWVSRHEAT